MSGDFKEKMEKKIEMKAFSPKAVQEFVRFVYGLEIEDLSTNLELVKELIEMGGLYNVPGVQSGAATFLPKHLNRNNKLEVLEFAVTHKAKAAEEICCQFVVKENDRNEDLTQTIEKLIPKPAIAGPVMKCLFDSKKKNTVRLYESIPQVYHYHKNKPVTLKLDLRLRTTSSSVVFTGLGLSLLPGSKADITVETQYFNKKGQVFKGYVSNDTDSNIVPITFDKTESCGGALALTQPGSLLR